MADAQPSLDKTFLNLRKNPDIGPDMARFRDLMVGAGNPIGTKSFNAASPKEIPAAPSSRSDPEPWNRVSPIPVHLEAFQPTAELGEKRAILPVGFKLPITEHLSLFASAAPYMQGGAALTNTGISAATSRIKIAKDLTAGGEATIVRQDSTYLLGNAPIPTNVKASFDVGIQQPSSGLGFGVTGKITDPGSNVQQYGVFVAISGRW